VRAWARFESKCPREVRKERCVLQNTSARCQQPDARVRCHTLNVLWVTAILFQKKKYGTMTSPVPLRKSKYMDRIEPKHHLQTYSASQTIYFDAQCSCAHPWAIFSAILETLIGRHALFYVP
jgi:hypothetical protein